MPIVGTAEILILANDSTFERSLRSGVAPGFAGVKKDAESAGADAGDLLAGGLAGGGKKGGENLRHGVKKGLDDAIGDTARGGTDLVDRFTNAISTGLGGLSSAFGAVGLTLTPLHEALGKTDEKLKAAKGPSNDLIGTVAGLGRATAVASTAGLGVFAAASVKMATDFQTATAQMAGAANIPIQAAQKIGTAFTKEGPGIVFTAQQQMQAYGAVAGQLQAVQGHALSTGEAVEFMKKSMDLAEETGGQLGDTTANLSQIMQTFEIPLSKTGETTTELFNASRITNVSVDSLTKTMDRLKARLGVAAPSVGDLSSLIVDLGEHGVTGSRGLMVVNTAINTLLQSTGKLDAAQQKTATETAKKVATAQQEVAKATDALKAAQDRAGGSSSKQLEAAQNAVAKATLALQQAQEKQATAASGTAAQQQSAADAVARAQLNLAQAQQRLNDVQTKAGPGAASVASAQQRLADAQKKLADAQKGSVGIQNANVQAMAAMGIRVYDAQGKFVGMRDVIAQLQPKLKGLTQQQQLQALSSIFGATSAKSMLDVVLAGPDAYDKAAKAVGNTAAAHNALAAQQKTVAHELEAGKVDVQNMAVTFGTWLLPKVKDALDAIGGFVRFLDEHKPVLYAFAAVVGTVLVGAMLVWIYTVGTKMFAATKNAIQGISNLLGFGEKQATKAKEDALTNQQSAEKTETAWQQVSSSLERVAAQIQQASQEMIAALERVGATAEATAAQIEGATGSVDAAVSGMAADTQGELGLADTAWGELGASAQAAAAEVGTASASIEADDAAVAEAGAGSRLGGLGGAGGMGKVGGALTAVTAGYAAYQLTSQALGDPNHPTAFGKAVGGAASSVADFLGVGPTQTYQQNLGAGLVGGNATEIAMLEQRAAKAGAGPLPTDISPSDAKTMLHNLKVPGFDLGGWVPGRSGAAVLAMVHAGEYILSRGDLAKMGVGRDGDVAKALTSFSPASQTPSRFGAAHSNVPGHGGGRHVTIAEGAVKQVFNTPMSAPAVANETGWALRVAATTGGHLKV